MLVANDRSVTDRLSAIVAEGGAHTKMIFFMKTIDKDYRMELGALLVRRPKFARLTSTPQFQAPPVALGLTSDEVRSKPSPPIRYGLRIA